MMARMLMISDEVRDVLKKLVAKAAERPTSYDEIKRVAADPCREPFSG